MAKSGQLTSPPEFLLIGAARSGTSAIANFLSQHPKIRFTHPKETHFFAFANRSVHFSGPGDDVLINSVSITSPVEFQKSLGPRKEGVARGEGSVSTLYYHEQSIDHIRMYAPDAKLIAILRHPVERAFSSFQYMRSKGLEPLEDFELALKEEASRIEVGWHHIWHYKKMGIYSESVRHFVDTFPPENLLFLFYDDFAENAAEVTREVFRFIGVDDSFQVQTAIQVNRSGVPRNRVLGVLISRLIRARRFRETLKRILPWQVRELLRNAALSESQLPAEVRSRLQSYYAEDVAALADVLGSVPSQWQR